MLLQEQRILVRRQTGERAMSDEQIQALNRIVAMVDEKAAKYKQERFGMHNARAAPEKKLILDLIQDAENLAASISPPPLDLLNDLRRLAAQLTDMS